MIGSGPLRREGGGFAEATSTEVVIVRTINHATKLPALFSPTMSTRRKDAVLSFSSSRLRWVEWTGLDLDTEISLIGRLFS